MVEPRFFEIVNLEDLLDIADYVRYIVYKVDDEAEDSTYFKILASRFYWEGWINHNSRIYKKLMETLTRKGVEVKGALDLNNLAGRF